jgi:DNA polymerase III epsilon subunit-like protein
MIAMNHLSFIVVDVETGGLDPRSSALLEIAALDMRTDEEFHQYVLPRPGSEVHPRALEVNGLTIDKLRSLGAVSEQDAVREFCSWISAFPSYIFAGANPKFDWGFLSEAIRRWEIDCRLDYHCYDIQTIALLHHEQGKISLPVYNGRPSPKVDNLIKAYRVRDLREDGIHGGAIDVMMEANILGAQLVMWQA